MQANFRVLKFTAEHIVIRDLPSSTRPSVTNDAEAVVARLDPAPGQRIFYYDSQGQLDELVHASGRFTGFAPGPKIPDEVEAVLRGLRR